MLLGFDLGHELLQKSIFTKLGQCTLNLFCLDDCAISNGDTADDRYRLKIFHLGKINLNNSCYMGKKRSPSIVLSVLGWSFSALGL